MTRHPFSKLALGAVVLGLLAAASLKQDAKQWAIHDPNRPQPAVVTPGTSSCGVTAGTAPSDAIDLFSGSSLDAWRSGTGPAKWTVDHGILHVNPRSGDIQTAENFENVQLHIEWMIPANRETKGQGGGNSGVYFMNQYEIQILNAFENTTYADGTAASFYGQHPPLVNPCRPKGEWNVYDIVFHAPQWDEDGNLVAPAHATVLFNGVLVQDHQDFWGSTAHARRATYGNAHGPGPIRIQDHGDPIMFRNIWARRLGN
jgi:hypothetical protein